MHQCTESTECVPGHRHPPRPRCHRETSTITLAVDGSRRGRRLARCARRAEPARGEGAAAHLGRLGLTGAKLLVGGDAGNERGLNDRESRTDTDSEERTSEADISGGSASQREHDVARAHRESGESGESGECGEFHVSLVWGPPTRSMTAVQFPHAAPTMGKGISRWWVGPTRRLQWVSRYRGEGATTSVTLLASSEVAAPHSRVGRFGHSLRGLRSTRSRGVAPRLGGRVVRGRDSKER